MGFSEITNVQGGHVVATPLAVTDKGQEDAVVASSESEVPYNVQNPLEPTQIRKKKLPGSTASRAKKQKQMHRVEDALPISFLPPAEEEPEPRKKASKRKRLQNDEEDEEWKHDDEVKAHFACTSFAAYLFYY